MKVKELVEFLSGLDQDAALFWADYYYGDREGFSADGMSPEWLSKSVIRPKDSKYYQYIEGNSYLVDFNCNP